MAGYEPVGWKNYPDKTTSISAENLNHMDEGIKKLDTEKLNIDKITQSTAVNQDGYALDAREKNASISGTMANQISELNTNLSKAITTSNIGSQSVNYANSAGTATTAKYATYATAKYNGNPSPLCVSLSESQVQFVWNTSVMRVDVYVDKTYIGHIVTN